MNLRFVLDLTKAEQLGLFAPRARPHASRPGELPLGPRVTWVQVRPALRATERGVVPVKQHQRRQHVGSSQFAPPGHLRATGDDGTPRVEAIMTTEPAPPAPPAPAEPAPTKEFSHDEEHRFPPLRVGDVVRHGKNATLTASYRTITWAGPVEHIREDGMSFGLPWDEGYTQRYKARPATEAEAADRVAEAVAAAKAKQEKLDAAEASRKALDDARAAFHAAHPDYVRIYDSPDRVSGDQSFQQWNYANPKRSDRSMWAEGMLTSGRPYGQYSSYAYDMDTPTIYVVHPDDARAAVLRWASIRKTLPSAVREWEQKQASKAKELQEQAEAKKKMLADLLRNERVDPPDVTAWTDTIAAESNSSMRMLADLLRNDPDAPDVRAWTDAVAAEDTKTGTALATLLPLLERARAGLTVALAQQVHAAAVPLGQHLYGQSALEGHYPTLAAASHIVGNLKTSGDGHLSGYDVTQYAPAMTLGDLIGVSGSSFMQVYPKHRIARYGDLVVNEAGKVFRAPETAYQFRPTPPAPDQDRLASAYAQAVDTRGDVKFTRDQIAAMVVDGGPPPLLQVANLKPGEPVTEYMATAWKAASEAALYGHVVATSIKGARTAMFGAADGGVELRVTTSRGLPIASVTFHDDDAPTVVTEGKKKVPDPASSIATLRSAMAVYDRVKASQILTPEDAAAIDHPAMTRVRGFFPTGAEFVPRGSSAVRHLGLEQALGTMVGRMHQVERDRRYHGSRGVKEQIQVIRDELGQMHAMVAADPRLAHYKDKVDAYTAQVDDAERHFNTPPAAPAATPAPAPAPAATPAPAPAPAPASAASAREPKHHTSATYNRLKDDTWGARIEGGPVAPGDRVTVTKRSGEKKEHTVRRVRYADAQGRYHIVEIT